MTSETLRPLPRGRFSGKTITTLGLALSFALAGCATAPQSASQDNSRAATDTAAPYISAPDAVERAKEAPARNVAGVFEFTVQSVAFRNGVLLLNSERNTRRPDTLVVEVMPAAQREVEARVHQPASRYFLHKHITVQGVARRVVVGRTGKGKSAALRYGTRVQMDRFAQVLTILE